MTEWLHCLGGAFFPTSTTWGAYGAPATVDIDGLGFLFGSFSPPGTLYSLVPRTTVS